MAALAQQQQTVVVTELRLLRLSLLNFKGVSDLTIEPNGRDMTVFGKNGTGKSTLAIAMLWLFTGKDFDNKENHEIKTLDADMNVIPGLEHEVEGVFTLNGKQVTFKRTYCEKWGTERGPGLEVMKGNTTKYEINEVPSNETAYKAKVASICDPAVLPVLINLSFFNRILNWEKRREILIDACGDITDADVIDSNRELADLPGILKDKTTEEHQAWAMAQQTKVSKEREDIPVRINEARRLIPDTTVDEAAVNAELSELRAKRAALQEDLNRITSGAQATELRKQLTEIDTKVLQVKNQQTEALAAKFKEERKALAEYQASEDAAKRTVRNLETAISDANDRITWQFKERDVLVAKFNAIKAREFVAPAQMEVCPSCQQPIPEDRLEEVRTKALQEFNLQKSTDLEANREQGGKLKAARQQTEADIERLTGELEAAKAELSSWSDKVAAETQRLSGQNAVAPSVDDPQLSAFAKQKAEIQDQIDRLSANVQTEANKVREDIAAVDDRIRTEEGKLAQVRVRQEAEKRVSDLSAREKQLAAEFEKLSREIYLIKLFTQTKVRMLDEKISARFSRVKFQLFEIQVNGGLKNKCVCTMNGRPYDGALSTGEKVIADLDIVNTLAQHYGFIPVTFLDNLESVTSPVPTVGQQIRLVVSPADATLRIEHAEGTN